MYNPKEVLKSGESRDINLLHPKVKDLAEKFLFKANEYLNPLGFNCKIISTVRSFQKQNELFNQGRTTPGKRVTNARGGQSIHNWGCAFDIGIFKDGVYGSREADKYYELVAKFGKQLGLEWGGDWTSIVDRPHYQYTGKYSNSEFLRLANSGTSIDKLLS